MDVIRRGMAWWIGGGVMCAAACASAPLAGDLPRPVTIERVEVGGQSGVVGEAAGFRLVTAVADFARLYGEIHAGTLPEPTVPAVDFDHFVVLAAFLGEQRSAGYGVDLGPAQVVAGDGGPWLEVTVTTRQPPPGAITAQVITSPYSLVRVPVGEWRKVRFRLATGERLAELHLD